MGKADKRAVVEVLEEIATLLELKNENPFKIRAFANAARVLDGHPGDLGPLLEKDGLEKLKGIGKGHIAKIVRELYATGKSKDHEALRKGFPESLFELFKIPGLGPKRIKLLYDGLKIKSVGELEYACRQNQLTDLEGFGTKSQEKILQGIGHFKKSAGHFRIDFARAESRKMLDYLKKQKGILKLEIAGSIRRHKEIIKDIDVLAAAKNPGAVHRAFVKYPGVESVIAHGETKSSVVLRSGMNCDLRTVTSEQFPFALHYFTGSKEHNVAVRTVAKKRKMKINEYGLFKGKRLVPCRDEEALYEKMGFRYIPPEARENTGELEWTSKKPFPKLVEERDLKGVFHVHSDYSDGVAPLEAMIARAQAMKLEYVGISDHSQSARYARGLEPSRLKAQWKEIDRLQKKFKIRIFKGTECDILTDGKMDYPDSLLSQMDFVIASVHSHFQLPEREMTVRIKRAMQNKYVTFLGHPTGRLILGREGYRLDLEEIIRFAKKAGVVMELNANPHRLDLDWRMCQFAKKQGVLISINPDAHSEEGLEDITYGTGIARKGWLEKKDVLNTRSVSEIESFLKKRRL